MAAYYNEIDEYAADWLENLIRAGHIAPGDVDRRSILDVHPDDLRGYTQCHFFAGIGVWSYALRLAGWSDDRPVWTGSCPCQPFSAAGKGAGFDDERHLWPAWFHLITKFRPPVVLGEQVASKDGLGWLDLVQADLQGAGYAVGAQDLCVAGVGGPHIRQRLWFVGLVHPVRSRLEGHAGHGDDGREPGWIGADAAGSTAEAGGAGRLADADGAGRGARGEATASARHRHTAGAEGCDDRPGRPGPTNGFWRDADWLFCRDGKWRPVEARVQQVVDGVALRVGRLRSDLQQQAEEVIREAAERLQTETDSLLREMWEPLVAEEIFGPGGRLLHVYEAQILLSILLEYAGAEGREPHASDASGAGRGPRRDVRVLWRQGKAGDPSHQRRLDRQPLRELADALRLLSSTVARFAQEAGYPVLYKDAPASFPLSGDVPENQVGKLRPANRVGRLRAYGNAISPWPAKAFIEAVMETQQTLASIDEMMS